MGLPNKDIQMVEQPMNNKPDKVNIQSLSGYDSIRGTLEEHT